MDHALRRNALDRSRQAVTRELEDNNSHWTKLILGDCKRIGLSLEGTIELAGRRADFRRRTFHGMLTPDE